MSGETRSADARRERVDDASAGAPGTPDLALLARLPRDGDEPVFRAPWEAHAFAMTLALHARGQRRRPFGPAEDAARIEAAQVAGDPDLGDTYYQHWLAALEALVAAKGAGSTDELERYRSAWALAAARTPHGQPIELRPADLEPSGTTP